VYSLKAGENCKPKHPRETSQILRGAYAPFYIIVSPSGLFGKWEEEKKKEVGAYIFRGAYTTIAIIVSPCGL
jgi:hypothetical protein